MDILKVLNLADAEFIKKLNLSPIFSQKELKASDAIKEPITYALAPFNIDTQEFSPLTLVTSMNLQHEIQLFNNLTEDKDEDGIVGTKDLVKFDPNTPLLKYSINIQANAGTSTEVQGLSVGIKTGTQIKHCAYLKHQPNATVEEAILKDVASMPFIFSLDRVKKLQPGEALSFEAYGDFGVDLSFNLADLLIAGASALQKYLGNNEVLNLDVQTDGKMGVKFSVKDSFQLVFAKTNEGKYHVLVKKAKTTNNSRTLGFNVQLSFKNPGKITELINSKIAQLMTAATNLAPDQLKTVESKLQSIADGSVPFDQLGELEKLAIQALAKRLNIPHIVEDALNKSHELLNKLATVKNNLQEDITKLASQKFKAGFTYDYSYISTKEVLIEALINDTALAESHKGLILMSTQGLVAASANKDNVQILNYVNSESVERNKSWGFALGVGNFKIGGSDKSTFAKKVTTRLNHGKEEEFVVYRGVRGYNEYGSLGGYNQSWWGGMDAQTPQPAANPTVDLFDYSLHVEYNHTEKKLKAKERDTVAELLNLAGTWGIINNDQLDAQTTQLLHQLTAKGDATNVQFNFDLMIPPTAFSDMRATWLYLLQQRPEVHLQVLANAFASVMPYSPDYTYRKDQRLKVQAYGSLWKLYFDNEGFGNGQHADFRSYAKTAEATLKKVDNALAAAEGRYAESLVGDNRWFGGIIRMNPDCGKQMNILVTGMRSLLENIQAKSVNYDQTISRAFRKITQGFSQSFYTKALAPYFISMANNNPVILNDMKAALTITFTDGEQKNQTLLIQMKP
ncbi:hypothetical protein [uncultured Microscilla sp.]|uniref:hypothetical protein n=1 Tax=uncultured Microscilla sp. TaxID=432653 RepID=UPI00261245E8|nr:hypothetical protein [uncultured Microscilla sp.]